MKKKIIIALIMMLLSAVTVRAESNGYILSFREGHEACADKYNLRAVVRDKGIYFSETAEGFDTDCIKHISPNSKLSLIISEEGSPEASLYSSNAFSAHSRLINADAMIDLQAYGNDIKVAVIDTGCYPHDEFRDNLLPGKNYISDTEDVTDNIGHGTHVSGIIGSAMDDTACTGIAPKAKLVPLKCFDSSHSTRIEDILPAIYDAVDTYGCRIINMSWGIKHTDENLKEALDYASEKGAILVAAVGNYGSNLLCYPAAYDNVIGVSSIALDKTKSNFAQYNNSVTVTAPGEDVQSTANDGGYVSLSGTSHTAPMISGIAAVALSVNPNMTNEQFRTLLTQTAEDLGDAGYDTSFGYGLADEKALLERMMEDIPYYISPINTTEAGASVLVKNNSSDTMEAVSIFSDTTTGMNKSLAFQKLMLSPNEDMTVTIANTGDGLSHFLWSDFGSLRPLTVKR